MTSGLLDTSIAVDWHDPAVVSALPDENGNLRHHCRGAPLGPHLAATKAEAARQELQLQEVEASLDPIASDGAAARSYGLVVAAVVVSGRQPRSRFADLLIAPTAHANGLDLYTRNGRDLVGLGRLVNVIDI